MLSFKQLSPFHPTSHCHLYSSQQSGELSWPEASKVFWSSCFRVMIFINSKKWKFACDLTLSRIWLCSFPCLFFQGICNNQLPAFTGAKQQRPPGSKQGWVRRLCCVAGHRQPGRPGHPTSSGTQRWVSANASFPCHLFQRRHVTGPAARNTATKYRHCQGTSGNCLCQKMRLREILYPASAFPHLLLNTRKNYTSYICLKENFEQQCKAESGIYNTVLALTPLQCCIKVLTEFRP